jgi:hypothetical protein
MPGGGPVDAQSEAAVRSGPAAVKQARGVTHRILSLLKVRSFSPPNPMQEKCFHIVFRTSAEIKKNIIFPVPDSTREPPVGRNTG